MSRGISGFVCGALVMFSVGCGGPWDINNQSGGRRCTVERGWTKAVVRERYGAPSAGGTQRKTGDWSLRGLKMCSADVDLYGCYFVLYNCAGLVKKVTLGWPGESVDVPAPVDCPR